MRVRSAIIVVVVAIAGSQKLWCKPQAEGGPQRLGEQVWKIIDQKFLDPSYNHRDPRQIRDQLLAVSNRDTSQTYTAVRSTLQLLGDPQTRLLEPAQLAAYTEYLHGEKPVSPDKMFEVVKRTKAAGIWNVPTMAVMEVDLGLIDRQVLISRPELEYMPRFQVQKWMKLYGDVIVKHLLPKNETEMIEANREKLLRALNERGARILLGTDSPQLFNVPGFSVFAELEAMARAGMTPYQVLRSATQNAGAYLHESVGTVTAGSRADLILLNANPLAHLNNVKTKAGVMVNGQWLPESDLQRELSDIRAAQNNFRKGDAAVWIAQSVP
jgi:hypothetical protein